MFSELWKLLDLQCEFGLRSSRWISVSQFITFSEHVPESNKVCRFSTFPVVLTTVSQDKPPPPSFSFWIEDFKDTHGRVYCSNFIYLLIFFDSTARSVALSATSIVVPAYQRNPESIMCPGCITSKEADCLPACLGGCNVGNGQHLSFPCSSEVRHYWMSESTLVIKIIGSLLWKQFMWIIQTAPSSAAHSSSLDWRL